MQLSHFQLLFQGIVNIAAVDADTHRDVGGKYGVQGFPTIKIFGANKNSPSDYQGGRTAQAIVDQAMSELKKIVNARMGGKSVSILFVGCEFQAFT